MVLGTACSNLLSAFDLVRKSCVFNKSTDNSQVISTALHALCSDACCRHTPTDTLPQFIANENTCIPERCKDTFGFEYIYNKASSIVQQRPGLNRYSDVNMTNGISLSPKPERQILLVIRIYTYGTDTFVYQYISFHQTALR